MADQKCPLLWLSICDIFLFPDDPYNGTVTDSLLPIQRGFDITCKDVHLVHVHAGH